MAAIVLLVVALVAGTGHAQDAVVVEGTVVDAQTGEPVPGASVFAVRAQRGTYSSVRGFFRLVLPHGTDDTLRVRSLGYEERCFPVRGGESPLRLALAPAPIGVEAVPVVAELSAEEIILNAQQRRQQNWGRVRTAHALVYSKLVLEAAREGSGEVELRQRQQEQVTTARLREDTVFAILETFTRWYYDAARGERAVILQRRQTRNIPSQANVLVFGNLGSLYQERVRFFTVEIPSPIGPEALERYRFRVRERKPWGSHRLVYVLEVEPRSRIFPAFEGTIAIVDSTFALVEADLRPSGTTALPFLQQLRFVQRCEHFPGDIWFPTFAELSGTYGVSVFRGVLEVGGRFVLTRIVTEVHLNEPLPDTVFAAEQRIQVAPLADSVQTEFWQRYALAELSPRELEMYRRMDTLAQRREGESPSGLGISLTALPIVARFNRVNGLQVGLAHEFTIGWVQPALALTYAFGRARWEGWARLGVTVPRLPVRFAAGAFAWTSSLGWDRTYPEGIRSLVAALFHRDYSDWAYREGGSIELAMQPAWGMEVAVRGELFRLVGLPARVGRSLFVAKPFRENPRQDEGRYRIGGLSLRWGDGAEGLEGLRVIVTSGAQFSGTLEGVLGEWRADTLASSWERFWAALVRAQLELPTFSTGGYQPMRLRLWAEVGTGKRIPLPYQFRLRTSVSVLGRLGHSVTAPLGVYGGRQLVALAAEHTFTDLWWRALGLPTVRGRGLELILTALAARTGQAEGTPYRATGRAWYTEIGLGLGRIPLWFTELLTARLDICRGLGGIANGRWGAVVQIRLGL